MTVALPRWVRAFSLLLLTLCLGFAVQAQERVISGKITDTKDGSPLVGATVSVKGTNTAVSTGADGTFRIGVPAGSNVLVISSIGFGTREIDITGKTSDDVVAVNLTATNAALNEVVVVGYGTARKKDVTGSVSSVKAKDFNQGVQLAPDQLIQGKVAGVQILNNSGQPGGQTTVRIRGNASIRSGNQPLFVVDGVPLDGRSSRPGLGGVPGGVGNTPDANPLNFINPNDIASIDVLKDASATAIYGSRGANGVVMITTKRGVSGAPRVDASAQAGISRILKKLDVLNGDEYRQALDAYGVTRQNNDWGGNVDALDAITRTAPYQNYNVSVSSGNDNARYRTSIGYLDQKGILLKSGIKKYTANLNASFKFLESRKLGLDINILTAQTVEDIAPVSNNSGFEGSLIGQALQWNPTRPLRNGDGSLNIKGAGFPATAYNPLAFSEAYDDNAKSTNVLASIAPSYKITDDLEYKMILSLNYSTGNRNSQIRNFMNFQATEGLGWAFTGNNELTTQQVTHTLNYNKQLNDNFSFGALAGYEYMRFANKGMNFTGFGFPSNAIDYWNYLQSSTISRRSVSSFSDPISYLQSFFGRVNLNYQDRFLLTATFRADGSSKFGENNRYGYFPSLAAAWNITNENFMKGSNFFDNLKLRLGWGITGNQEFPAGAATERYRYRAPGDIVNINVANPNLKWETSTMYNAGLDFSVLKGRLSGSVDYFNKQTQDLLFFKQTIAPAPDARGWINLPGTVLNSGLEVALNYDILRSDDWSLSLGANAAFLKNELKDFPTGLGVQTGEINGQGLTGARAQRLENGQPLNAFWMGRFLGIDKDGNAEFEGGDPNNPANRFYVGSPNPKTLLGVTLSAGYKKFNFTANMNGAFGHQVYNNTTQATLAIGNIKGNRNIAKSVFNPSQLENTANAQPVSTRYLEKGDYFRAANMTLSYNIGKIGSAIRSSSIYITGQNLFLITKYSGFDPEVNTPKAVDDVPSFGIEYTPYPTARTFILGINFTL